MSRDSAALRDIAAAAREVIVFAGELDRDAFLADMRT